MQLIFVIIQSLIEEKHIVFSDDAKQQMEEMKMICEKMFHNISKVPEDTQEWLQKVHDSENFIDQKTEESTKVTWNVSTEENVMMKHASFSLKC